MTDQPTNQPQVTADPDARRAAQKRRNIWLALALFAFVVIVGVTTAIRLGGSDLGPDGGLYWRNDPASTDRPAPDMPPPSDGETAGNEPGDAG